MRYRAATDANHTTITEALRRAGVQFRDVARHPGLGCDIIARHVRSSAPVLIEIKDGSKPPSARKLKDSEATLMAMFPGAYVVVLDVDDALAAVGLGVAGSAAWATR